MPHHPATPIDTELLDRFLARRCTGDEQARVEAWLLESPNRKATLVVLTEWASGDGKHDVDVDAALRRVKQVASSSHPGQLTTEVTGEAPMAREVGRREQLLGLRLDKRGAGGTRTLRGHKSLAGASGRRWRGWTAASASLIFGLLAMVFHGGRTNSREITRTYATGNDQQMTLVLDDQSRVTLTPNTRLRLVRFGAATRTIALEGGEAYVEVAHAEGAPFSVRSGSVTTRVLGTAFLVQYVPATHHVRVAVTDGKVQLAFPRLGRPEPTLVARSVGEVNDSVTQISTIDDLAPNAKWVRGQLFFQKAPVDVVLRTLGKWYGYQFRCADSALTQQRVTIAVSMQSSTQALSTLENILNVNLAVVGDTVTLTAQPVRPSKTVPRVRTYDVWTPTPEVGR